MSSSDSVRMSTPTKIDAELAAKLAALWMELYTWHTYRSIEVSTKYASIRFLAVMVNEGMVYRLTTQGRTEMRAAIKVIKNELKGKPKAEPEVGHHRRMASERMGLS